MQDQIDRLEREATESKRRHAILLLKQAMIAFREIKRRDEAASNAATAASRAAEVAEKVIAGLGKILGTEIGNSVQEIRRLEREKQNVEERSATQSKVIDEIEEEFRSFGIAANNEAVAQASEIVAHRERIARGDRLVDEFSSAVDVLEELSHRGEEERREAAMRRAQESKEDASKAAAKAESDARELEMEEAERAAQLGELNREITSLQGKLEESGATNNTLRGSLTTLALDKVKADEETRRIAQVTANAATEAATLQRESAVTTERLQVKVSALEGDIATKDQKLNEQKEKMASVRRLDKARQEDIDHLFSLLCVSRTKEQAARDAVDEAKNHASLLAISALFDKFRRDKCARTQQKSSAAATLVQTARIDALERDLATAISLSVDLQVAVDEKTTEITKQSTEIAKKTQEAALAKNEMEQLQQSRNRLQQTTNAANRLAEQRALKIHQLESNAKESALALGQAVADKALIASIAAAALTGKDNRISELELQANQSEAALREKNVLLVTANFEGETEQARSAKVAEEALEAFNLRVGSLAAANAQALQAQLDLHSKEIMDKDKGIRKSQEKLSRLASLYEEIKTACNAFEKAAAAEHLQLDKAHRELWLEKAENRRFAKQVWVLNGKVAAGLKKSKSRGAKVTAAQEEIEQQKDQIAELTQKLEALTTGDAHAVTNNGGGGGGKRRKKEGGGGEGVGDEEEEDGGGRAEETNAPKRKQPATAQGSSRATQAAQPTPVANSATGPIHALLAAALPPEAARTADIGSRSRRRTMEAATEPPVRPNSRGDDAIEAIIVAAEGRGDFKRWDTGGLLQFWDTNNDLKRWSMSRWM